MAERQRGPRYMVTVTDESGCVVFRGAAAGEDSFTLMQTVNTPARLVCDIGDMTRWLRVQREQAVRSEPEADHG